MIGTHFSIMVMGSATVSTTMVNGHPMSGYSYGNCSWRCSHFRWRVKVSMGGTSSDLPSSHLQLKHFIPPPCNTPMTSECETETGEKELFLGQRWTSAPASARLAPALGHPASVAARPPWLPQSLQALPRPHSWFLWTAVRMLWLGSQLWGLEAVLLVCELSCLRPAAAAATSFVMSAARPATLIAQRLWEGEKTEVSPWKSPIGSCLPFPLLVGTWLWVGLVTPAWPAGHPGAGQRSARWKHSFTVALPLPSILQKLSFSFLRFGCRSADSCFSTRFTRPAGPSCWLVEHSRVAQLPLIGVQQLGKFASKFKAELHNDVVAA